METKNVTEEFNPDDWQFERSSGYAGYRNSKTSEWILNDVYRERKLRWEEDKVWEEEIFRILKLHTKSDALAQHMVNELKLIITIYKK